MAEVRKLYKGAHNTVLITLPQSAKDALEVKAGDMVTLTVNGDVVEIKKLKM